MGVRAVPQHYFKNFCIDVLNEKCLRKLFPPLLPQFIFFIDPALNNAAYLVTISGKNKSKCHSAFRYESFSKVLQYIHFIQLLTL